MWLTHPVPQALAYASLASLSPTQGLHSNAVAPFFAAPFASSRYLQTGTVALSSLLAGTAISGLHCGAADAAGAASLLALGVGAVRVLLGSARAGRLLVLIPVAVLEGFVSAACCLVFATQLPVILGAAPPPDMHFLSGAAWLLARPALWQPGCLACAAATVACLLGGKRLHPLFPGAVVATLLGCAAVTAGLPVGATVGAVSAGMPQFVSPATLPWHLAPALAPATVAIGIAGVAEAAAVGRRFAREAGHEWDFSREVLSQGTANLGVALFGGFPVSGSLSRTSLSRTAGASSQLAHAITGLAVLAVLPLGAQLLAALPRAVLGGLVAVSVLPLCMPGESMLADASLRDAGLGWATLVATMVASPRLELGLLAGLGLTAAAAAVQAVAEIT
jgi:SulP family sulfate permease